MFGERHDLPHEFPNHKEMIEELLENNAEFAKLCTEYDALDAEILQIEQNVEAVSDAYAEELKMKRVHLKDQLYGILKEHAGN